MLPSNRLASAVAEGASADPISGAWGRTIAGGAGKRSKTSAMVRAAGLK
ncbi:hypothetical protein [Vreelandella venusta]